MTLNFVYYSESYIRAAGVTAADPLRSLLVLMQLTGHAIECAMKACIASTGGKVPQYHNLVNLGDQVLGLGFNVSEQHRAFVVHVNHIYAHDLYTESTYKARYPSRNTEALGGSVPPHSAFAELVTSLCLQAKERNEKQSPASVDSGA
jgi:hypothetical protein